MFFAARNIGNPYIVNAKTVSNIKNTDLSPRIKDRQPPAFAEAKGLVWWQEKKIPDSESVDSMTYLSHRIPWDWDIYLHLGDFLCQNEGTYTSLMDSMGFFTVKWFFWHQNKNHKPTPSNSRRSSPCPGGINIHFWMLCSRKCWITIQIISNRF